MKVLLSIKPKYVQRIFEGEKKYEYRKSLFKKDGINTIVIYATKPVGKVVGEFTFDTIIKANPEVLWEETKSNSGISKKDYLEYFKEKDNAYAIEIKDFQKYDNPLSLEELNPNIKSAPQSFMYI
ncbi:MAG: ASCH domain-containing protein [Clostridiaceae bacterium]|nr:ASCH domain-containing protein [Clostridiaceae bacterium]